MRLPRTVVVALAGLLVGLQIMVMPMSAHAATVTKYSDPVPFEDTGGIGWRDLKISPSCNGSAWWKADYDNSTGLITYYLRYKAACTQIFSGFSGNNDRAIRVDGVTSTGVDCDSQSATIVDRADNSLNTWKEDGTILMGYAIATGWTGTPPLLPGLGGVCTPTSIHSSQNGASGTVWEADIDLGAKPQWGPTGTDTHSGTCTAGTPTAVSRVKVAHPTSGTSSRWDYTVTFRGAGATGVWGQATQGKPPPWTSGQSRTITGPDATFPTATGQTTISWSSAYYLNGDALMQDANHIGVQLYVTAVQSFVTSSAPGWTAPSSFRWGVTDVNKCLFWFGPTAFTDTTTDREVPWGAAPPPTDEGTEVDPEPTVDPEPPADEPTEPDPACEFDITDPTSWLEGGMCSLVGLFARAIDLLTAMLGWLLDFTGMLTDLFTLLFVPDPSTWGTEGMQTQFEERPPGSLITGAASGVQGMSSSMSDGGCGTLIDVSAGTGTGGQITCTQIKNVPGFDAGYTIFTLAIYAFTGLAVFRMFTGALNSGHD